MPSKKLLGAIAVCASLLGGGVAGALLGTPIVSLAQESEDTTTTTAPADDRPAHPFRFGVKAFGGPETLDAAAEALGISVDDLYAALRDGKSIADVAQERGVDVQTVIDAMVADATQHIDQAVADGRLDAGDADTIKAGLPDRMSELANAQGLPGPGPGGFHLHRD